MQWSHSETSTNDLCTLTACTCLSSAALSWPWPPGQRSCQWHDGHASATSPACCCLRTVIRYGALTLCSYVTYWLYSYIHRMSEVKLGQVIINVGYGLHIIIDAFHSLDNCCFINQIKLSIFYQLHIRIRITKCCHLSLTDLLLDLLIHNLFASKTNCK